MNRTAKWIAQAVCGDLVGNDIAVTGTAQTDSRECRPGDLFIARVGESSDGHDFAAQAVDNGAVAVLGERLIPTITVPQIVTSDATLALGDLAREYLKDLRATGEITVIGITGSVGKTTTKDLLGQILATFAPTVFPVLSFNNEVGCPLTILRAEVDTKYLVLEMGASGTGHLRYLTSIAPLDIAVELMVGAAHLGGFGSIEALAEAKAELVRGLVPDGTAILNADDPRVAAMSSGLEGPIVYFSAQRDPGTLPGAEGAVWAQRITVGTNGQPSFLLHAQVGHVHGESMVEVPLVGRHQVSNTLAAIGAALSAGLPLPQIVQAIASSRRLSPHRMTVHEPRDFEGVRDILVIDDSYNANPDSMRAGLVAAAELSNGRPLVTVLGDMLELGDDAPKLHRQVGELTVELGVAAVIAVGDYAEDLATGNPAVMAVKDVQSAKEALTPLLLDHSAVFLKGSFGSNVWHLAEVLTQGEGK